MAAIFIVNVKLDSKCCAMIVAGGIDHQIDSMLMLSQTRCQTEGRARKSGTLVCRLHGIHRLIPGFAS